MSLSPDLSIEYLQYTGNGFTNQPALNVNAALSVARRRLMDIHKNNKNPKDDQLIKFIQKEISDNKMSQNSVQPILTQDQIANGDWGEYVSPPPVFNTALLIGGKRKRAVLSPTSPTSPYSKQPRLNDSEDENSTDDDDDNFFTELSNTTMNGNTSNTPGAFLADPPQFFRADTGEQFKVKKTKAKKGQGKPKPPTADQKSQAGKVFMKYQQMIFAGQDLNPQQLAEYKLAWETLQGATVRIGLGALLPKTKSARAGRQADPNKPAKVRGLASNVRVYVKGLDDEIQLSRVVTSYITRNPYKYDSAQLRHFADALIQSAVANGRKRITAGDLQTIIYAFNAHDLINGSQGGDPSYQIAPKERKQPGQPSSTIDPKRAPATLALLIRNWEQKGNSWSASLRSEKREKIARVITAVEKRNNDVWQQDPEQYENAIQNANRNIQYYNDNIRSA